MKFGDILHNLIKRDKIKQYELADEMFLSYKTISSWTCGRTEPNISQLIELSNFFDVTVGQLVGAEELDFTKTKIDLEEEYER